MPITKNKTIRKTRRSRQAAIPEAVIVFHSLHKETLFPDKVKEAKRIYKKIKFID